MVLFSREFIAVPDEKKGQIVFKHPDHEIRKFTKAIVNADQVAMFVNKGQVVVTLPPGQHKIDAEEIPGLGILLDFASGGNMYKAELYFISTREFTGEPFGGRIDDVQDPQTGIPVTLRVFGEYSMRVIDPVKIVTNLVGTVDITDNEKITDWVDSQLLKAMKTDVTRNIIRNGWPILGLSAYIPEIEQAALEGANRNLDPYGIALVRMGNFDVNLAEEDEKTLKGLGKDTAYSRLAGSFQGYAQGEMMKGAGEGMSKGGGAVGPAFLGVGMGLGGGMGGQQMQPGPTPPPAPQFAGGGPGYAPQGAAAQATVACPTCQAANAPGAKFCQGCGGSLAPASAKCPSCQADNATGAKFCSECGGSMVPVPSTCATCQAELVPGAKFCPSCGTAAPA